MTDLIVFWGFEDKQTEVCTDFTITIMTEMVGTVFIALLHRILSIHIVVWFSTECNVREITGSLRTNVDPLPTTNDT